MPLVKTNIEGRFADFLYKADVEPVLEQNKLLRSMEQTKTEAFYHYAKIPNEILLMWFNEAQMAGHDVKYMSPEFGEIIDKKLKDPAWKNLLVGGPRHRVGYGD